MARLFLYSGNLTNLALEFLPGIEASIYHNYDDSSQGYTPDQLAQHASRVGWTNALVYLLETFPNIDCESMLADAAGAGHIGTMHLIMSRGQTRLNIEGAALNAAYSGQIAALKCLKFRGACDYGEMLGAITRTGNVGAVKMVARWRGLYILGGPMVMDIAAQHGYIKIMKLARMWGAQSYSMSFVGAALGGNLKALRFLKNMGVTNFGLGLNIAANKGHIPAMKLFKKWGANNFTTVLDNLHFGSPEVIKLLIEWAAGPVMIGQNIMVGYNSTIIRPNFNNIIIGYRA